MIELKSASLSDAFVKLDDSINTISEFINLHNHPMSADKFSEAIDSINESIDSLKEIRSDLENNQYDFDCCGEGSVEVEIDYHYSFSGISGKYADYKYNTDANSGSIQIGKEDLIDCLNSGGNIEELIIEAIDEDIRYNQY